MCLLAAGTGNPGVATCNVLSALSAPTAPYMDS
jgi:hypothetical protein